MKPLRHALTFAVLFLGVLLGGLATAETFLGAPGPTAATSIVNADGGIAVNGPLRGTGLAVTPGRAVLDAGAFVAGDLTVRGTSSVNKTSVAGESVHLVTVTGSGNAVGTIQALYSRLLAGYTGASSTITSYAENASLGTATGAAAPGGFPETQRGNVGHYGVARGAGTGANYGVIGVATYGRPSVGVLGEAATPSFATTNIGVVGLAYNTAATDAGVAPGYFAMRTAGTGALNYHGKTAALVADNGDTNYEILELYDNNALALAVEDTGILRLASYVAALPACTNQTAGRIVRYKKGTRISLCACDLTDTDAGATAWTAISASGDCT